jgi:hypothetical protein
VFTFGHRLRLWRIEATTKSGERSKGLPRPQHLGEEVEALGILKMNICKVAHQFTGSLPLDDDP